MRVRNIRGTKVCHPRGRRRRTWKQFWLHYSEREWPSICRVSYCTEPAKGGAHVEIEGQFGVFIVPMCEQHNNSENRDWLSVKKGTIAVPVDEGDTTGPPGPCYCYA